MPQDLMANRPILKKPAVIYALLKITENVSIMGECALKTMGLFAVGRVFNPSVQRARRRVRVLIPNVKGVHKTTL
jgi:hypothetical protein